MAFNGSGVFGRLFSWATDKTNTVPVTASRMDSEMDGFATGLSSCLVKDGQQTATARIPFALGISSMSGSVSSVSYGHIGDLNTGLYFTAADEWALAAGGTQTLKSTSAALTMTGTLTVSGATTLSSTLGVTGAATLSSTLAVTGNVAVNTDKFTVTAASGNTLVAGTLDVTGNVAVNTNKFNVTAASGNTTIAGTLGVTSDVAVNTNKFNVTASSGNTAIAGTLAVTGASTLTGALTANNAAGVAARNTAKAYATYTGSLANAFNVASITDEGAFHQVTFTTAMSGTDYSVMLTHRTTGVAEFLFASNHATTGFRVNAVNTAAGAADPGTYTLVVFENA